MKRILTALVLIPAVLGLLFAAPPWLSFVALLAVASLCYHEYLALVAAMQLPTFAPIGYLCGLVILASPLPGVLIATLLAMLGMALALRNKDLTTPSPPPPPSSSASSTSSAPGAPPLTWVSSAPTGC